MTGILRAGNVGNSLMLRVLRALRAAVGVLPRSAAEAIGYRRALDGGACGASSDCGRAPGAPSGFGPADEQRVLAEWIWR
jgi:hypothetical protein